MADTPEDNEPKESRELPAAETTSTISARTLERKRMPPRTSTDPRYIRFAAAMFKSDDSTEAYRASHPRCKSARQAIERGRALCRLPEVMLELQRLREQSTGDAEKFDPGKDPARVEWENELRLVAFAGFNRRKVPVKEKVSALRALGEAKGWLGRQQQIGQGVRATFNFHVGAVRRAVGGRTISVDVEEPVEAQVVDVETQAGPVDAEAVPRPAPSLFDASNT